VVTGSATAAPPDFDPAAATEAYLAQVSGPERERSDAYFEGGYWIQLWSFLIRIGMLVGILHLGLSAKIRDLSERLTSSKWVHCAAYWITYFVATTVVMFPWSLYTGYFREHSYDLANQDFGGWMGDRVKGWVLAIVVGSIMVSVFYAILRKVGKRWWLYGSALGLSFAIFGMTVAPVYVAPMFNEYTTLEDGHIKREVLRMARANGIAATEVYMSDASKQSKRISANVSGLLGTERITLNDNLLERCSNEEVEAVMGHEIGHYVLNHAYEGILFFGVVIVTGFAFVAAGFGRLRERFEHKWKIRGVDDPAGLPLIALLFSVFGFVLTPVTNTYIRVNEAEADAFGLNAARQPEGFADVALKLGEYRKLDPGQIEELLFFDHPSGRTRIRMAMEWKAAHIDAETTAD
jgi:STE24 endopeptidase